MEKPSPISGQALGTGHSPGLGHPTVNSPSRCCCDGVTLHFLKNSSVSLSTTSSLASSPPALIADTTSPCCLPSMQTPLTCEAGRRWGVGEGVKGVPPENPAFPHMPPSGSLTVSWEAGKTGKAKENTQRRLHKHSSKPGERPGSLGWALL